MKNKVQSALAALLALVLVVPVISFAQQPTPPPRESRRATPPTTTSSPPSQTNTVGRISPSELLRRLGRGATPSAELQAIENDFSEALTIVEDNYVDRFDESKLKYDDVTKSAVIGMLRSLDPHSNFYDRKEFDDLRNDQRNEYYGIGASINNWTMNDQLYTYAMSTFEGSPAARAGLRFGDKFIEVDGESMKGKTVDFVRDKIRGTRGTTVKITVERAASSQNETLNIVRDAVGQPSVPDAYMIRPGVGYVDMRRGFTYSTGEELQNALEQLRARGMTQLVLDLRDNPGGFLDQAKVVAETFLGRGQVILTQRGRGEGNERVLRSSNSNPDKTPLVVLINRNSASASEIVAGALQDHDRALIVGENSFGKGLVQSIINLDYGAGLTLTSAKYYTPSGRLIQRDYSDGSLYNYYTRGEGIAGSIATPNKKPAEPKKPVGAESKTDTGRAVFGGGGIMPDETAEPRQINRGQARFLDSIFFFTRDLVNGRVANFDAYKIGRAIDYKRDLQATEFPVSPELIAAYKRFATSNKSFNITDVQIERNKDFIARFMRQYIVMAAYGDTASRRVLVLDDPQTVKALDSLPRARDLAVAATQRTRQPPMQTQP